MALSMRRRVAAFPGNMAEDAISGIGYGADALVTGIGSLAFNLVGRAAKPAWSVGKFGLTQGYKLGKVAARRAFTGAGRRAGIFAAKTTFKAGIGYGKLGAKAVRFGMRHPGLIGLGILGVGAVMGLAGAGQQAQAARMGQGVMTPVGVPVGAINGHRRTRTPGLDSTMGLTMAMHNGRI